jgi:hypothetical protein
MPRARRSVQEIIKFVNYPQRTVYGIAKRYRTRVEYGEAFGFATRKWHARRGGVRTERVVKGLKKFTENDSGTPLITLGSKLKGRLQIIGRIAAEDLRYKTYTSKI